MSIILECKKLCLVRCLAAVALSICMQFILLTAFLLLINFTIFHPVTWISNSVGLMFSFYTWLSIIPLIGAVVIFGILLGKSHLAVKRYYATRFQWLLGTAWRKLIFFWIHVVMGILTAWMYAGYLHADYRHLFFNCFGNECINSRYTFLLSAGLAAGCFHFVTENLRQEPEIEFPIIQESKLVQIRSLIYITLYTSLMKSFTPTLCFGFAYWLLGGVINRHFAGLFDVEVDESLVSFFAIAANVRLLFYAWILSSHIISNMHLMQHFFSIFLSEEMHFPIARNPLLVQERTEVTLVDALSMGQVPVVQNLAVFDLYDISLKKTSQRRQEILTLSVPGGHPYNWNQLSAQCLCLIKTFTDELSTSVNNISTMKSVPLFSAAIKPSATDAAQKILLRQYNETFGIRRMMSEPSATTTSSSGPTCTAPTKPKPSTASQRINEQFEVISRQIEQALHSAYRAIPGLFYMFGEPDGAKTAYLLSNSQTIVWLVQGLAGISALSLMEDKYGVVQVTLPQIIKSLLILKLELDKLNNVNLNGKKLDRNLITLKHAVKCSIYKICTVFGDYLRDLIDEPEDLRKLQSFLSYQET